MTRDNTSTMVQRLVSRDTTYIECVRRSKWLKWWYSIREYSNSVYLKDYGSVSIEEEDDELDGVVTKLWVTHYVPLLCMEANR